jgi:hypothetical protein
VNTRLLRKNINFLGTVLSILILLGLVGPWINLSYDSFVVLNPTTRLGEKHYHSRIELSPFYATVRTDNQLESRVWFVSPGTTLAGIIITIVAVLNCINYRKRYMYFLILFAYIIGLFAFFLSLGRGVSIGVFTKPGWGITLALALTLLLFIHAFIKMTGGTVSRYI